MTAPPGDSVTVVVTRTVRVGCERAYEQWLHGVGEAASGFAGHRGLTVLRPHAGMREYTLIFRFDNPEQLRAWEESDVRRTWVERADVLCQRAHRVEASGMEAWFALPADGPLAPPPKWKMALVSWLVAFPTIQLLNVLAGRCMAALPLLVRGAAVGVGMILIMTYGAMPLATRVLARWLYAPPRK